MAAAVKELEGPLEGPLDIIASLVRFLIVSKLTPLSVVTSPKCFFAHVLPLVWILGLTLG